MSGGDLGQRVADRRHQLGLSPEEVAARTGMSPTHIHVVESNPSPRLSAAALSRLAAVTHQEVVFEVDPSTGGGPRVGA
jgi:transcriptional regulator with XRE-family HTH domain